MCQKALLELNKDDSSSKHNKILEEFAKHKITQIYLQNKIVIYQRIIESADQCFNNGFSNDIDKIISLSDNDDIQDIKIPQTDVNLISRNEKPSSCTNHHQNLLKNIQIESDFTEKYINDAEPNCHKLKNQTSISQYQIHNNSIIELNTEVISDLSEYSSLNDMMNEYFDDISIEGNEFNDITLFDS